jgi:hypothetical protein
MPGDGIELEPNTNRALIGTYRELPSIDLRSMPLGEEAELIGTRKLDERFQSNQSNAEWIGCLIPLGLNSLFSLACWALALALFLFEVCPHPC